MSEKLLPCPFCGGEASVHRCEHAFHDAKIRCAGCQAEGPIFDVDDGEANEAGRNEAEAVAAWNRRTPAPEGEVAEEKLHPIFTPGPLYASPVVPVGSGQADKMAHVLRGMVKRGTLIDAEAIDRALKLATYKQDPDDDDRAWAASQAEVIGQPVVPVGVSREEIARIVSGLINGFTDFTVAEREAFIDRKTDAILAALRPTDTGANHD